MATIKVKCPEGHEFYMEDYERKACPQCGRVVVGPKADESSGWCFLTTACVEYAGLPDNCWELQMIRRLRDEYIVNLPDGNEFLAEYYDTAPAIIRAIRSQPDHQSVFDALLHRTRLVARMIEQGRLEEALAECRDQLEGLKVRYLGDDASGHGPHR
jgi:hypothetical protein